MRTVLLVVLALPLVGCSDGIASVDELPKSVAGDTSAGEPRFIFVAPDGFTWNSARQVWHNDTIRTSIVLGHSPGVSFQSVVDDFVADRMRESGMELTKKEILDVAGRPTLLVHGSRLDAPYPQQVCIVAFATPTGCAQLTAIYPADTPDSLKMELETSLLESKYEVPD